MAVSVKATSTTPTDTSVSLTLPASIVAGDLIIVFAGNYNGAPGALTPEAVTGWNLIEGGAGSGTYTIHGRSWWKLAVAADAGAALTINPLNAVGGGVCVVLTGHDPGSPINDSSIASNSATSIHSGSITTSVATRRFVLATQMTNNFVTPAFTAPSGFSLTAQVADANFDRVAIYQANSVSVPNSYPSEVVTSNLVGGNVGIHIAVAEAGSWTHGAEVASSSQSGVIPAASLEVGDYEFEVRTADGPGRWGPWSAAGTFSVVDFINTAPTISPVTANGLVTGDKTPSLSASITDPDPGQTLVTTFEIASNANFTEDKQTRTAASLSSPRTNTTRTVTASPNLGVGRWYWRARVYDGVDYSAWTTTRYFDVQNTAPTTPGVFTSPTASSTVDGLFTVSHGASTDPDTGDVIQYEVEIQPSTGAVWEPLLGLGAATSRNANFSEFPNSTTASLRVRAFDGIDYSAWRHSSVFEIFRNTTPAITLLTTPGTSFEETPTLEVAVTDPDSQTLTVTVEVWLSEGMLSLVYTDTVQISGPASSQVVNFQPSGLDPGNYQWRAKVNDTMVDSAWTNWRGFVQKKLAAFFSGAAKVTDVMVGAMDAAAVYLGADLAWERKSPLPVGLIAMFDSVSLPEGWLLCDGTNETPDLRDRFIVGSGGSYALGATGGANAVTLTGSQLASHSHNASSSDTGAHTHSSNDSAASHSHSVTVSSVGHSHSVVEGGGSRVSTQGTQSGTVGQGNSNTQTSIDSYGSDHGSDTSNSGGNHSHNSNSDGNHNHSVTLTSSGGSSSHENRPPYLALYYGMAGSGSTLGPGMIVMSDATSISGWSICNGADSTPNLVNRFPVGAGRLYSFNATGGANTVSLSNSQMPLHNHSSNMTSTGSHSHSVGSSGTHSHNTSFSSHRLHAHTWTAAKMVYTNIGGGNTYTAHIPEPALTVSGAPAAHNYTHNTENPAHSHDTVSLAGNHTHSVSSSSEGSGAAHQNRPPYRATNFFRLNGLSEEMPSGAIALFYGSEIPEGWEIETSFTGRFPVGAGSTYSIAATGGSNTVSLSTTHLPSHSHNDTSTGGGGSHSGHTLSQSNMSHSHSGTSSNHSNHQHSAFQPKGRKNFNAGTWTGTFSSSGPGSTSIASHDHTGTGGTGGSHNHDLTSTGSHSHNVSVGSAGSSSAHENRPPYFALLFITKN